MSRFAQLIIFTTICLSTLTSSMPVNDFGARQNVEVDVAHRDVASFGSHVGLLAYRQDTSSPESSGDADDFDQAYDEDNEDDDADEEADEGSDEDEDVDDDDDDDEIDTRDIEDQLEELDIHLLKSKAKAAPKKAAPKKAAPKPAAPAKAAPKPAAAKKPVATKAAPKAAAVKTTKAAAKPAATKAPAKATKAAAAPKKTAAKATKATAAPKKTTAKATKASATVKASKTTSKSASATASACPRPSAKAKAAAKKPSVASKIKSIFIRDSTEFVGFHGTNSDTADLWEKTGFLVKPTKNGGLFDFFGVAESGTSGADQELGPGVYVADELVIATGFANNNAKQNSGTTPKVCAIFARSSANWRVAIRKAFIPEKLVGDSSNAATRTKKENARLDHITKAVPGVSKTSVVKFSLLDRKGKTGQMVIPALITNQFSAQCFDPSAALPAGASSFPAFSFNGNSLRTLWNIADETAGECAT